MSKNNDSQTDFSDFGGGAPTRETKPPIVPITDDALTLRSPANPNDPSDGASIAGHVADGRYRGRVYVSKRRRDTHFYFKGNGYAVSTSVLQDIEDAGADRLLFYEHETMNVYEFELSQYTRGATVEAAPDWDPQKVTDIENAVQVWEDVGDPTVEKRGGR